ncbi:MAG: hypothetical protein RLZZ435_3768, partial [Cyanobacteriota bacterium]
MNTPLYRNGYAGQPWLVEERDACGVGFIAHQQGQKSHDLLEKTMVALGCMEHRGGCSADRDSGDGSGVLTAIPWGILQPELGLDPETIAQLRVGVGMFFLPQDPALQAICREIAVEEVAKLGLKFLGWRSVPVKTEVLGVQAKENQPDIEQLLVQSEDLALAGDDFERLLYRLRRRIGNGVSERFVAEGYGDRRNDFYPCSLSCRTIVYKGMVRSEVLGEFYQDLKNPAFEASFAVYHRRFSTNTMPRWPLAQPMRMVGHNGEINTLLGNINWMVARQPILESTTLGEGL